MTYIIVCIGKACSRHLYYEGANSKKKTGALLPKNSQKQLENQRNNESEVRLYKIKEWVYTYWLMPPTIM